MHIRAGKGLWMWWLGYEHGRAVQGRAAQEILYSLNVSVSKRWQLSRQMTAWCIVTCTNRQMNSAYYGRFWFNDVLLFFLLSRIRESWSKFWSLLGAVSGFRWNEKAFYISSEAWFGSSSIGRTGVGLLWMELEGFYRHKCIQGDAHITWDGTLIRPQVSVT